MKLDKELPQGLSPRFHLHCGIGYTTLADLGLLLAPYDISSLLL